jgi:hypothetical protein
MWFIVTTDYDLNGIGLTFTYVEENKLWLNTVTAWTSMISMLSYLLNVAWTMVDTK